MLLPFPWVWQSYEMLTSLVPLVSVAARELLGRKSKCFVKGGCRIFFSGHEREGKRSVSWEILVGLAAGSRLRLGPLITCRQ